MATLRLTEQLRIAKAKVKRDDIKARARQRREMDELRHQENMESVLSKTKGQFWSYPVWVECLGLAPNFDGIESPD